MHWLGAHPHRILIFEEDLHVKDDFV
jgi:hypothetical protein